MTPPMTTAANRGWNLSESCSVSCYSFPALFIVVALSLPQAYAQGSFEASTQQELIGISREQAVKLEGIALERELDPVDLRYEPITTLPVQPGGPGMDGPLPGDDEPGTWDDPGLDIGPGFGEGPPGLPPERPPPGDADLYPVEGDDIPGEVYAKAQRLRDELPGARDLTDYVETGESQACDAAIRIFLGAQPASLDSVDDYFSACGVDTWPASSFVNADERQLMAARLGVFVKGNGEVFCTGFILRGNQAITARHCLRYGLKESKTHFRQLSNPAKKVQIRQLLDSACDSVAQSREDRTFQACDYIYAEVELPEVEPFPVVGKVDQFDRLKLVGYHTYKHFRDAGIEPSSLRDGRDVYATHVDQWHLGFVVSSSATCSALQVQSVAIARENQNTESTCIMHSCQAIGGMSGSPLFTRLDDGSLAFSGVHVGTNISPSNDPYGPWSPEHSCNVSPAEFSSDDYTNLAVFKSGM